MAETPAQRLNRLIREHNAPPGEWRVGQHYGIHVYEGDRPVATFHDAADAERAVAAVNATLPKPDKA